MRQKFTLRTEYVSEKTGELDIVNEASIDFPSEVDLADLEGELLLSWVKDAFKSFGYSHEGVEELFNAKS